MRRHSVAFGIGFFEREEPSPKGVLIYSFEAVQFIFASANSLKRRYGIV